MSKWDKKVDYAPKHDCVEVKTLTQKECFNEPIRPVPNNTGTLVKVPVVLAELTVQFNVDAKISLPEPALEIKQIHKRLKLTQCTLLQNTNKLFIKGFVRKNIEFATPSSCSNARGVCGNIRHCTVDIPISCVTRVKFTAPPIPVYYNKKKEFEFLTTNTLPSKFPRKDLLLSGDLSEFNQFSQEYFNELPFCELISSKITEFDEFLNLKHLPHGPFEENTFKEIEEKMDIELTLKILQLQQVQIGKPFKGHDKGYGKGYDKYYDKYYDKDYDEYYDKYYDEDYDEYCDKEYKKDYDKYYDKEYKKGYEKDYDKEYKKDYDKDYDKDYNKKYKKDFKKDHDNGYDKDYDKDCD
ncbi:CsxC family protein [Desulfolucanica intricata]|uniref:CsxC family protein n=1 Tax=Desulfolucanica intricata TaxID=1285191 RepID=UPI000AE10317|nr:hypothetical protein [Desulfolucanica intricata]